MSLVFELSALFWQFMSSVLLIPVALLVARRSSNQSSAFYFYKSEISKGPVLKMPVELKAQIAGASPPACLECYNNKELAGVLCCNFFIFKRGRCDGPRVRVPSSLVIKLRGIMRLLRKN